MYDKTIWENGQTPLSEANLNHIEEALEEAHLGTHIYAESTSDGKSYSISFTPALTAYNTGLVINFKAGAANKGKTVLDINGLGPIPIKKNVSMDLEDGDIKTGQIVTVIFDSLNFQIINPVEILTSLFKQKGDLIFAIESQQPARLPAGIDGQYLKMVSGIPAWVDSSTNVSIVTGCYRGDGKQNRLIYIGISPKFVIVAPNSIHASAGIGIASNPYNLYSDGDDSLGLTDKGYLRPAIVQNGFIVSHRRHSASLNRSSIKYNYFAIG